jgi:hypothetical protein
MTFLVKNVSSVVIVFKPTDRGLDSRRRKASKHGRKWH